MTTAEREGRITCTEVSSHTSGPVHSVAPNGSGRSTDYYTTVVRRQEWSADLDNGVYAGLAYRVTETYISQDPKYRGQFIYSTSQPW
jgi:hypothetical protein